MLLDIDVLLSGSLGEDVAGRKEMDGDDGETAR